MLSMSVTAETFQESRGWSKEAAPSNMLFMLVTFETSQESRGWSKEAAPSNMLFMSSTDETSQLEMSPSKEVAPSNMPDMSVTPDRSGASVALYAMLEAPRNAFAIEGHSISPHRSIDRSCGALS